MKFRPHKSRRGPLPFRYVLLLSTVFFIFSIVVGILIVNKGLKPVLMSYAESQNSKIAAYAVSHAVEKLKADKKALNEMIEIKQNKKGNISSTIVYPGAGSKIAAHLQQDIQSYLDGAEEGKISEFPDMKKDESKGELVYSVPIGRTTSNVLLGNIGPEIPIRFHVIGDTEVDLKPETGETGINGTEVKLNIDVKVHVQTIIPFASNVKDYTQTISLLVLINHMDVPLYNNGNGNASPPSIQIDEGKDN